MPDVRTTAALDDFERASENPLSYNGRWSYMSGSSPYTPMKLNGGNNFPNNHATRQGAAATGLSFWKAGGPIGGDVEVWGWRQEVGSQIGHNERLNLLANEDPESATFIVGYSAWFHTTSGGNRYYIFRYNEDGTRTELIGNLDFDKNFVLFRRSGDYLEIWDCPAGSHLDTAELANWTMRAQVMDTTYIDRPLWLSIGEGDNFAASTVSSGWRWFGGSKGGSLPQLPQIIRRTHQRGGLWKP